MGYGVVNVWWLVNSMITDLDHPMNFYEKDENGNYQIVCSWNDAIYKRCKDELYTREINWITITDNELKIYLKRKLK